MSLDYSREHLDEIASMDDMHSHKEQIERQARACEKKCTPLSVDKENRKGTFYSSNGKPYKATFITEFTYSCTCPDFGMRRLPCKHIYRLGHELGIRNLENVKELMSEELIEMIEKNDRKEREKELLSIFRVLTNEEQERLLEHLKQ